MTDIRLMPLNTAELFSPEHFTAVTAIQSKTGDASDLWTDHYKMSISKELNAVLRSDVLAQ